MQISDHLLAESKPLWHGTGAQMGQNLLHEVQSWSNKLSGMLQADPWWRGRKTRRAHFGGAPLLNQLLTVPKAVTQSALHCAFYRFVHA